MHIILAILGAAAAAAFWYYRLKTISEAASEITDAAGRARGALRRRRFRLKSEDSPLMAVDDPVTAAAIMMVSIATVDGPMDGFVQKLIRSELKRIAPDADNDELLTFAKWASDQVGDPDNVSLKLSAIWKRALSVSERRELLEMVTAVADASGDASYAKTSALRTLATRLAISA